MARVVIACLLLVLAPAARAATPNVVFIISDDQHFGDYGFMGHEHIETPNLDALAERSRVYRRGYVTTSLCCPSLASMVTGRYPRHTGITGNLPGQNRPEFPEQQQAYIDMMRASQPLPELLAERGYLSFQSGKWWCGSYATGGFTHGMTHGDPARGGRHGDVGLAIGRQGLDPIADFLDLTITEEKPFFLWYAPFLPHTPHNPPERLFEKYRGLHDSPHVARYWAMCEWFDETCGELLALLEDKGVADNTMIVYICDNGWINRPDRQGYAPRSKRSPYDGGLRTPVMLCWPGVVEPGEGVGLATNLDLVPTVLAACGVEIPGAVDGVDLLAHDDQPRVAFSGAVYSHDAVEVRNPEANLEYRWRIDGRWKLILPNTARFPDRATELYNILVDPEEQYEVSTQHPDVVAAMTQDLTSER